MAPLKASLPLSGPWGPSGTASGVSPQALRESRDSWIKWAPQPVSHSLGQPGQHPPSGAARQKLDLDRAGLGWGVRREVCSAAASLTPPSVAPRPQNLLPRPQNLLPRGSPGPFGSTIPDPGSRPRASVVAMNRRRKWADAPPFARGKVTRKALSMLKYIKAQEGPLDVTALLEALDRWVRAVKPERRDVLDVLREVEGPPSRKTFRKILEWATGQEWFEANLRDYTRLLEAQGRMGDTEALERTVESMQESGYSLDRVAFFVLIREYARGGRMDMAEGVLERMEEAGCPADARCFEALLAGFGRAGMLDKAEATLQEMRMRGLRVSPRTYAILITAYGRSGRPEDAQEVFDRMQAEGESADLATYTALMLSKGKAGQLQEAVAVFEQMRESGVAPDDTALALLVECHQRRAPPLFLPQEGGAHRSGATGGNAGTASEGGSGEGEVHPQAASGADRAERQGGAEEGELQRPSLTPPQGFGSQGPEVAGEGGGPEGGGGEAYRQAVKLVLEQEAAGLEPGVHTYTALIALFASEGLVTQAREVFQEMREAGIEPPARAYARLFEAYARAGQAEEAQAVLDSMKAARWAPNEHNYGIMIEGLLAGGLLEEAGRLLTEARGAGLEIEDTVALAAERAALQTHTP